MGARGGKAERTPSPEQLGTIRTLLPMLRTHPWGLPAAIVLGVLASMAEGVGISLFVPLLETATAEAGTGLVDDNWISRSFDGVVDRFPGDDRLLTVALLMLFVVLLRALLLYASEVVFAWLEARVGHELRTRFFDHLVHVDYSYVEKTDTGRLLNALSNETWTTTDAMSYVVRMAVALSTMVIYVVLLLALSWELTLLVGTAIGLIALIARFITRRVDELSTSLTEVNAVLATRMLEGCSGAKVIRLFGRETHELTRFERASWSVSRLAQRMASVKAAVGPTYEFLAGALLTGVLYFSLQDDPNGLPSLLVFLVVLYRLLPRVREFDDVRVELLRAGGAVREVARMMDAADKPFTAPGEIDARDLDPSFRLDHVSFRYAAEDALALDDVSIDITAGTTTALVGPSGAGKSTIIDTLVRFRDPQSGVVTFGGCPLADVDVVSLRRRVAVVSQDIYLFNATARENIAYGSPDTDPGATERAAVLAHAHEFVQELPQGYDTMLGDDGVRLSGGQRQRIALARAIMCDPDVLILDEATNALDSIAESIIQDALDILSRGRTVIVIAHRLATVKDADHIVVLDKGRVVESGTLNELMELDGMFARLSRLQQTV